MLLVLRAQAAIERAAALRLDCKSCRHLAWREKLVAIKPVRIAADEIFAHSVDRAVFAKIHAALAINNLCGHELNRR